MGFGVSAVGGCGGPANLGTVIGTLVKTDYSPISGITVSVGGMVGTSISSGTYTLAVPEGSHRLSISGLNYIPRYHQIDVTKDQTTHVPLTILAPFDSKTTQIGPNGGVVTNTSGSITLTIPSGLFSSDTNLIVTQVNPIATPAPPPAGYMIIGLVYILPEMDLSSPVTLSVPNAGLPDGATVPFLHFNTATLAWDSMANGTVSTTTNTITVQITSFGWLAAITEVTPSPGNITGRVINSTSQPIANANVWTGGTIALTDNSGNYTLTNLPEGDYVVYASKTGYSRSSVSVHVTSNSTVTAPDIVLTRTPGGNISGKVMNAYTSVGIPDARVTALSFEAYTNSAGNYTLYDISPGTVLVSAYASGYNSGTKEVTVVSSETVTCDFALQPTAPPSSFTDDFETDTGKWTISSTLTGTKWHRVNLSDRLIYNHFHPTYVTLPGADAYLPFAHGGSYAYWYGEDDLTGDEAGSYIGNWEKVNPVPKPNDGGFSSQPHSGTLTSVDIDTTNWGYGKLSFWTWWEVESMNPATGYDYMRILVSTNQGGSWTEIGRLNPSQDPDLASKKTYLPYTSGGFNQPGTWVKHNFNLTSYVGGKLRIRFLFETIDHKYNGFRGWFIDDVEVAPAQIGLSQFSPASIELRPPLPPVSR